MSVEHKTQALVVQCIDFRFQQSIEDDLESRNLKGGFDRISWPGASRDFDNVAAATEVSLKLHNPDEVYIYEHEDWGAYGEDNLKETHRQNAHKLKAHLLAQKPALSVTTLIATFDGLREL